MAAFLYLVSILIYNIKRTTAASIMVRASRDWYISAAYLVIENGKNKGIPVEKVLREQPGYYGWILNSEFPLYTKKVLTAIKLRMKDN